MRFTKRFSLGLTILAIAVIMSSHPAQAQWVADGQAYEGQLTLGIRAGFGFPTQSVIDRGINGNTSSGVGPVLNFEAMYGISKLVRLGMMFEYQNYSLSNDTNPVRGNGSGASLGTLHTVSLLPTVEVRPGRLGPIAPYVSAGIGVNINSFSEDGYMGATRLSPDSTFAFRLAGGMDYPITQQLSLNTELAWKRNNGGYQINGSNQGAFDASALNFLLGLRMTF